MKRPNLILFFTLLIASATFAQEEKKQAVLILNNGLASVGINFKYADGSDSNPQILELNAGTTAPYIINPGIRFYTKRGFNEIGFNNILLGGRGEWILDNTQNMLNSQTLNLFSSSIYFNKSYKVTTIMEGQLYAGVEPTFNYSTVSNGSQSGEFKYLGRNFGGDLKLLLRWDHNFKENAFISLVGGLSPFYLNSQQVVHRLTSDEIAMNLNQSSFDWRVSQVIQISFGFKI
ncbi:MAG: hypothetical protein ACPGLV_06680 [Bacteroidia bacterium]